MSTIELGIPAEAICEFLNRLDKANVPMHALLIMRHGKLAFEGYYAPYEKNMPHRMFSICKSLNALAIGLLEADSKLSLDDKIVDYFPDKVPENVHPFIAAMTIRDMLMMKTCHASTTYKYDWDFEWVESFFTVKPTHRPGKVFRYDTSAAHVLCALVQRISGQNMLDFLKDRVLRKIGWSEESYVLLNQFGDLQGGSGLMCTPMDLALLGQLLLQRGNWQDEQLLPRDFVDIAISNLTPTTMTGPSTGELPGYGYQIWHGERNNFVLYGLGGQFAICMPDYDLVCVTCADTQGFGGGNRIIFDSLYETLLPAIDMVAAGMYPMPLVEGGYTAEQRLSDKKAQLHIKSICEKSSIYSPENTCLSKINGKKYCLEENSGGFTDIKLEIDISSDSGVLSYTYQGQECSLTFGLTQCQPGQFPVYDMYCCTSGSWISPNIFLIYCHLLDTSVGNVQFELCFGDGDVSIFMKKLEETLFLEYTGALYGTLAP
ncbi:MAG: serine hydrolase [Lachnospiraceae bacterium]|nr:serine hydrolase [Lachnospiraceae bacterium]